MDLEFIPLFFFLESFLFVCGPLLRWLQNANVRRRRSRRRRFWLREIQGHSFHFQILSQRMKQEEESENAQHESDSMGGGGCGSSGGVRALEYSQFTFNFSFLFLRREIKFAAFSQKFAMCLFVLFVYLLCVCLESSPFFPAVCLSILFYLFMIGRRAPGMDKLLDEMLSE